MSDIAAEYRSALYKYGETVTVRRYTGSGPNRPKFDADAKARVVDFAPDELVGDIIQGDRKLILLARDLFNTQWPVPPKKGDKVVVRGRELNIESVDDNTRRVGNELVAYEIRARG